MVDLNQKDDATEKYSEWTFYNWNIPPQSIKNSKQMQYEDNSASEAPNQMAHGPFSPSKVNLTAWRADKIGNGALSFLNNLLGRKDDKIAENEPNLQGRNFPNPFQRRFNNNFIQSSIDH